MYYIYFLKMNDFASAHDELLVFRPDIREQLPIIADIS